MLKFFRNSRHNLMIETPPKTKSLTGLKAAKYFKYAIGEIILVVLGILIALSINNASEYEKDRKAEQILLRQLQSEFKSNLEQLDHKIQIRNEIMASAKQFFFLIDHPEVRNKDSVDLYIAKTLPYVTYDPIENDLSGSGELMLIKNIELKQRLTRWSSNIKDVMEDEDVWKYYRNELYMPFLIKHYQFRTLRNKALKSNILENYSISMGQDSTLYAYDDIGDSLHNEDYNALLDQPDLEDHLSRCYSINKWCNIQSDILRNRILEIMDLIAKEIK